MKREREHRRRAPLTRSRTRTHTQTTLVCRRGEDEKKKKEKRRVWKKRNRLDGSWSAAARGGSFAQCSGSNFGKPDIDRNAIVIQSGRLQDNGRRAQQDGRREDPQEESIQNHGHVLPILADLRPTAEKRERNRIKRQVA